MPRSKAFEPWAPPLATLAEAAAVHAVAAGTANAEQQKRFMHFLVERVCGYGEEHFIPGDERATAYGLGKRRVATYLKSVLSTPLERFREPEPQRSQINA